MVRAEFFGRRKMGKEHPFVEWLGKTIETYDHQEDCMMVYLNHFDRIIMIPLKGKVTNSEEARAFAEEWHKCIPQPSRIPIHPYYFMCFKGERENRRHFWGEFSRN